MNIRFQNAIARKAQATPPVWCMRQAGRYHAHYQALRAKHSFMDLCRIPELASEVAMGPMQDFDFDVAILFSDLLFPLDALGMGLSYEQDGPKLKTKLNPVTIHNLVPLTEALPTLHFQKEAMIATRNLLPKDKSLIGFVGGAWTLFAYAVEGSHSGGLLEAKKHFSLFAKFCEQLIPLLEANIVLQLSGGAEIVMLFDTAAGELSPVLYQQFVVPTIEILAKKFPGKLGYYSKGTSEAHLRHPFFASGLLAGMGIDHRLDLPGLFGLSNTGFLQGNFDQALLHLDAKHFAEELKRYLEPFEKLSPLQRAGWVAGLGHGVLPKTPEANVHSYVKIIRETFR